MSVFALPENQTNTDTPARWQETHRCAWMATAMGCPHYGTHSDAEAVNAMATSTDFEPAD
jgi:hypothetical protein